MKDKSIKILSIIGIITCLYIVINYFLSLIIFIFLVHPAGDTLMAISWIDWFMDIIFNIALIVISIFCLIDFWKTYSSNSVKIIKNNKRIIFSGSIILILAIYPILDSIFSVFSVGKEIFYHSNYFLELFIGSMIRIIPGLVIVLSGLFILRKNRVKFKEQINIEEQGIFDKKLKLSAIVIFIVILVYLFYSIPEGESGRRLEIVVPEEETKNEEIVNFDDCIAKGGDLAIKPGSVYESYPRQCNAPDGRIFIENLEEYAVGEETKWREYEVPSDMNEGIKTFDCPDWMQNIEWDRGYQDKATLKFYFDNLLDQETQIAYLSKKTGAIAFIIENIIEEDIFRYKGFNKINFIYPDHKIVSLYANNINIYWQKIGENMKFSPDGRYLSFVLNIYDSHRTSIVDINTGRDILLGYDVSCQIDDIVWSDYGRYVAINSSINFMSGEGLEGILLGDMAENVRLNKIFSLDYEEVFQEKKKINKLRFDESSEEIYFSVGKVAQNEFILEMRYKYNIPEKDLIIIE